MSITLKIVSYQRLNPGQQEQFQSDQDKFSIGRNPDNHWPLPDPQRFMSGIHCWLEIRNGTWYLTDTSTNGVYVNGSDERVAKNDSVALNQGDRLRLGDYELQINLEENPVSIPPVSPIGDGENDNISSVAESSAKVARQSREPNTHFPPMDDDIIGDGRSIDDIIGSGEEEENKEPPPSPGSKGDRGSRPRDHFPLPREQQPPGGPPPDQDASIAGSIGDDWDTTTGQQKSPIQHEVEASPVPAVNSPSPESRTADRQDLPVVPARFNAGSALAAFTAGAGIDLNQLHITDEDMFFRDLGELLNTMTEGLMQTISSRSQIKSEFRLEQTLIAPLENNPFKFSVSAQQAMTRLLDRRESAYQSGSAAAAEAVDDINAHQIAVMAGTEAALRSILRQFNPTSLESSFEGNTILSKAMPMLKKAKNWEFYKLLYNKLSTAADDDFQQFFGTKFSDAYEKQLQRLRINRKESTK